MSINLKIEDVCIQLGIDIHKFNLENPEIKTEPEVLYPGYPHQPSPRFGKPLSFPKSDRCHMTI